MHIFTVQSEKFVFFSTFNTSVIDFTCILFIAYAPPDALNISATANTTFTIINFAHSSMKIHTFTKFRRASSCFGRGLPPSLSKTLLCTPAGGGRRDAGHPWEE